jgi:hypothetical protein
MTHVSNSYVHQIVVRGTLSLSLEDGAFNHHPAGSIIAVPFNQKMSIQNRGPETLEFSSSRRLIPGICRRSRTSIENRGIAKRE